MDSSADAPHAEKRHLRLAVALLVVTFVMIVSVVLLFLGVGRWLIVEDSLDKAQDIVVLSGRIPERAKEAARFFNAGFAPQIWLTRTNEPAASLQEMHIAYIGEDFFNSRVLMHEGVPSNAIRVLELSVDNTAEENPGIVGGLSGGK